MNEAYSFPGPDFETVRVDGVTYTPDTAPSVYAVRLAQRHKEAFSRNGNYWEATSVEDIALQMSRDARGEYEAEQGVGG